MHIRPLRKSIQDTNMPDIDLDRDLIVPELEEVIALGTANTMRTAESKFMINISTIIMSALLFLVVLAWFDFIQTAFYNLLLPEDQQDEIASSAKFWYAIFATIIVLMLIYLIYYHSQDIVFGPHHDDDK